MKCLLSRGNLAEAAAYLAKRDRDLARILKAHGVPPLWARRPGFSTLIRIILEQQVSLASARGAFSRLKAGVAPFTPDRFLELGLSHLRRLGVTRQKAAYCINLADAMHRGEIDLRALTKIDDHAVRAELVRIKGIGPWTADIYLLMALRRPDVWPSGDVALTKAVCDVKRFRRPPSPVRLLELSETWRPFRSVAARMLWQHYLVNGARNESGARKHAD